MAIQNASPPQSSFPYGDLADLGQMSHCLADLFLGVFIVLKLSAEVCLVRAHVEMTVPEEIKGDHLFLAGCLAHERLVDCRADGVRRLGCWNDAFGAGELDRRVKGLQLLD